MTTKGRFITLKSGRVIFIPEGRRRKWEDVRGEVLRSLGNRELKRRWEQSRRGVLSKIHHLDDVISGRISVGVEGRGGRDVKEAKEWGLFTTTVRNVPIFARTKRDAQPLIDFMAGGGKYGSPEFSRLLGYTEEEIDEYVEFLVLDKEIDRRGIR